MRVYIPFDDGSSVSFDGESFTVHGRPMDIDEDLRSPSKSKAERAWQHEWEPLVRALESAWRRQREAQKRADRKQVYKRCVPSSRGSEEIPPGNDGNDGNEETPQ
ncbi:MAG: hypothetical protein K6E38_08820 [Fretibacterium sp.]|nr:hypothetical protein [Fretibacterium sp.]